MEFSNDKVKFTVPDRPTVRQQMHWFGAVSGGDKSEIYTRYWDAAKTLIDKWECAELPDYKADMDSLTNPTQTHIMIWAGLQVLEFMNKLEDIPKNS